MIGANIKRIMKRKMWTQARLAEAIGVSESTLHGWLADDHAPNAYAMLDIADALNISVLEIYGDENDREKFKKNHG